ncbi:MAG: class F sortase [Candidatus Staskawiczbacteria bacterium]|nr:class F sortase [Candidatus Staskawiczbacteria bacterium]
MKINKIVKFYFGIGILLFLSVLWTTPIFADKSPAGCTGSGLGINLYADVQEVHIGDTIFYSIDVFNGANSGPVVCDASEIQASIVTPDGITHPIALLRTLLLSGQTDSYPNVIPYTAMAQDVKTDGTLAATASDTGNIHQNDTNSQGGGNQGVNVRVIGVLVAPPLNQPSGGGGGGGSEVSYNPIPPVAAVAPPVTSTLIPVIPVNPLPPPIVKEEIVAVPVKLPNTGFSPENKDILWNKANEIIPQKQAGTDNSSRLKIPKINVNAVVGNAGLTNKGSVGVPNNGTDVAWFDAGPRPGETGTAIIVGHYGPWKNGQGSVFDNLNKLKKGDKLYVEDRKSATIVFIVREIKSYDQNATTPEVFNSSDGKAHLNLITCQGIWNQAQKTYSNRLVVFADKE